MNKQQLASKIWASANKMRSKIEANEYKDYILGFIFYKFLSDKEVKYLKSLGYTDDDIDSVKEEDDEITKNVQENLGYFIGYENLFSTWLDMGSDFSVANVHDGLNAFNRLINPSRKKVFEKIFDTLQTGISKLGDGASSQTKAISDLIHLIKDIPMDEKQDYDVLGFIYEYLISNFAANAGKKAGEFYTPHEVSMLMSEIVAYHLGERDEIKVYDPTSGSGSLLINIGKAVAKHTGGSDKIKYYAQELKENTYNLTRMNLVMRGILPDNIETRNGDTLEEDWPYFDENDPVGTYEPLYVDAVVSNPPYSQNWNPTDKDSDPRYSRYGLAPKGKADYAFLLHDLFHIKPDGIMTIVLPHGVLFRGGEEGEIRKNLIENNNIDTIIGLPANIFFGTGIPTIIMVLKQNRENTDVLIIDASKGFEKEGKNNKLRACDIKKISDTYKNRIDQIKYSKVVSRDEIRLNDYNLNIPRYVDSSESSENWDIYASMYGGIPREEVDELSECWSAFPTLKDSLFKRVNDAYYEIEAGDIASIIKNHADVKKFVNEYKSSFDGFDGFLQKQLISGMRDLNIAMEEDVLSDEIFKRLSSVPLVNFYDAFEILDKEWNKISVDLEIIQTEGFTALKQVDPNMVVKKKNGKEQEVQEGWVGHVIPFEIVQNFKFTSELNSISDNENALSETISSYDELLDQLPEDEKEKTFVNEDKTAFVWKEVNKTIKAKNAEDNILNILKNASEANKKEKKLKKQIKDESAELHMKTKGAIETLSDEETLDLIKEKWITPLMRDLLRIPDGIISELCSEISHLELKYAVTMNEVEEEIIETEKGLAEMLGELIGDEYDMKGISELINMLGGIG